MLRPACRALRRLAGILRLALQATQHIADHATDTTLSAKTLVSETRRALPALLPGAQHHVEKCFRIEHVVLVVRAALAPARVCHVYVSITSLPRKGYRKNWRH